MGERLISVERFRQELRWSVSVFSDWWIRNHQENVEVDFDQWMREFIDWNKARSNIDPTT